MTTKIKYEDLIVLISICLIHNIHNIKNNFSKTQGFLFEIYIFFYPIHPIYTEYSNNL